MHATLTVLGSGTSMGVPTIGCDCATCRSADPHDRRTRPSITVQYGGKLVLIDTTPDFREQALREGIRKIDAILYTHGHADHILGLDDVRPLSFPRITGGPKIPLYANKKTGRVLQHIFKYIFDDDYKFGSIAQVELHEIDHHPIELFGATFTPVPVIHGETEIFGFRFGSAAYLTDFSEIPEASMEMLHGLDILFLDALRHKPHPTHSTVENSISIVQKLAPKRTFFTHISHDLPHDATNRQLPANIQLAHDGLKLEFEI
jgi:phosphoribosyl 1,2-cyclic phosphate phosphodiesterase